MLRRLTLGLALWLGLLVIAYAAPKDNVPFGLPGKASTPFEDSPNAFLIEKEQFVLSYNAKTGTPNWVAWKMVKESLGKAKRGRFFPERSLPKSKQINPKEYRFSVTGMTRGHMCPRSDRTATQADSNATFTMANMVPQTSELNAGAWNDLEIYTRHLIQTKGKEVYLIAGPSGIGGRSTKGFFPTIASGKVTVPSHCWKVLLVVDVGDTPLKTRVKETGRLIAVVMPNSTTPTGSTPATKWWKYRVSTKKLEELTGLKVFPDLDEESFVELKAEVDQVRIPNLERDR